MPSQSGTVYVDGSFKPRGREEVFVHGRIKIGTPGYAWAGTPNLYLYPKDLNLKMIKNITFSPLRGFERVGVHTTRAIFMSGSIGSMDTIDTHRYDGTPRGCYVVVKPFQVMGTSAGASVSGGSRWAYIGTIGKITASFWAVGR